MSGDDSEDLGDVLRRVGRTLKYAPIVNVQLLERIQIFAIALPNHKAGTPRALINRVQIVPVTSERIDGTEPRVTPEPDPLPEQQRQVEEDVTLSAAANLPISPVPRPRRQIARSGVPNLETARSEVSSPHEEVNSPACTPRSGASDNAHDHDGLGWDDSSSQSATIRPVPRPRTTLSKASGGGGGATALDDQSKAARSSTPSTGSQTDNNSASPEESASEKSSLATSKQSDSNDINIQSTAVQLQQMLMTAKTVPPDTATRVSTNASKDVQHRQQRPPPALLPHLQQPPLYLQPQWNPFAPPPPPPPPPPMMYQQPRLHLQSQRNPFAPPPLPPPPLLPPQDVLYMQVIGHVCSFVPSLRNAKIPVLNFPEELWRRGAFRGACQFLLEPLRDILSFPYYHDGVARHLGASLQFINSPQGLVKAFVFQ